MEPDPVKLRYASVRHGKERFSWPLAGCCAITSIATLGLGFRIFSSFTNVIAWGLLLLLVPIILGVVIGYRTRSVSHVAGHAAVLALSGAAPAIVWTLDQSAWWCTSPEWRGSLFYLSVAYPLTAAIYYFFLAFLTAAITRIVLLHRAR